MHDWHFAQDWDLTQDFYLQHLGQLHDVLQQKNFRKAEVQQVTKFIHCSYPYSPICVAVYTIPQAFLTSHIWLLATIPKAKEEGFYNTETLEYCAVEQLSRISTTKFVLPNYKQINKKKKIEESRTCYREVNDVTFPLYFKHQV